MNKSIIKYVYILLLILILSAFTVFCYNNLAQDVQYFCTIMQKVYTTKLVYISSFIFMSGFIGGYALCAVLRLKVEQLCNAYQKRHDNISIEKDDNQAKIAVLEAKIQTLEAALDSALKNK